MKKIAIKDANSNGRLDWYDVVVYWGTTGLNIAMLISSIAEKFF